MSFIIVYVKERGVALRKESVDRNVAYSRLFVWIAVALRKESVDRNFKILVESQRYNGRSPQGERG